MTKYEKRILHLLSTANKLGLPFHPDVMNYMNDDKLPSCAHPSENRQTSTSGIKWCGKCEQVLTD